MALTQQDKLDISTIMSDAVKDLATRTEMHHAINEAVESLARDVVEGFHGIDERFDRIEKRLTTVEQNGLEVKYPLTDVVYRSEFLGLKTQVDHLEQPILPE